MSAPLIEATSVRPEAAAVVMAGAAEGAAVGAAAPVDAVAAVAAVAAVVPVTGEATGTVVSFRLWNFKDGGS